MAKTDKNRRPSKIQRTERDCIREYNRGRREGFRKMLVLMLWVLKSDVGLTDEQLDTLGERMKSTAESLREGYITYRDMETAMHDEFDWIVELV